MADLTDPLFLFGPGYSARALARLWPGQAYASVRTPEKRARVEADGLLPIGLDDEPALMAALTGAHLIVSAPPGVEGCPALSRLGHLADLAESVTYLSTTGVYGDRQGGWVFEWSGVSPQSERARQRVVAEQGWSGVRADARLVRLPGIYGPGRSPFERLRQGTARRIVKPGQVFSRIHVEDLAAGLAALIGSRAGGVFHLCDDMAAPPQDVTAFAARLLGIDPGPETEFDTAPLSAMARSFYSECKRVSNARLKAVTGWRPAYPTYFDGLSAILAEEARFKG